MDLDQDGAFRADRSIFQADVLPAGPGRQPHEWLVGREEDIQKKENNEAKQILALNELTPEPDQSLFMQNFLSGDFQEFYPYSFGFQMPEMDMTAFDAQAYGQHFVTSRNRSGNQRDETWRRDRDRWYPEWAPREFNGKTLTRDDPPLKALKAAKDLRSLLDFYFEPFNLQHNKFMLDLLATKAGTPHKALLSKNTVAELRFDPEELKGLNRIYAGFERLEYSNCKIAALDDPGGAGFKVQRRWIRGEAPGVDFDCKNLRFTDSGEFMVKKLAEVRSFLVREDVDIDGLMSWFLSAAYSLEEAPKNKFTMVSLNCRGIREGSVPEDDLQQTEGKIRRQILLYQPDIICIQGLNPWQGQVGFRVATSLMEGGYFIAAHVGQVEECNTIFYHEKRFELLASHEDAAVADLKFLQAEMPTVRVACIEVEVPPSKKLKQLLDHEAKALVIVADCLPIGGTEVLHNVEELTELRSAYRELGKEEVSTPVGKWDPLKACPRATEIGSSGLLKLHRPDCILYSGEVDAIAALSGHNTMYLATLGAEEALAQFSTLRMPLLSVFQWT